MCGNEARVKGAPISPSDDMVDQTETQASRESALVVCTAKDAKSAAEPLVAEKVWAMRQKSKAVYSLRLGLGTADSATRSGGRVSDGIA